MLSQPGDLKCYNVNMQHLRTGLSVRDRMHFIYLFGVLCHFQHCTGHMMAGSWKGRGQQYIQFIRVLYCKLLTNGKQLPAFPFEVVMGIEPRPQRWEARVPPLCHRGPLEVVCNILMYTISVNTWASGDSPLAQLIKEPVFISVCDHKDMGSNPS